MTQTDAMPQNSSIRSDPSHTHIDALRRAVKKPAIKGTESGPPTGYQNETLITKFFPRKSVTVEDGLISQTAADEMSGENRQTFILRLEECIRTRCGCPAPSSCSGLLSKKFNEAVETGAAR
jgi:hypothetical protein